MENELTDLSLEDNEEEVLLVHNEPISQKISDLTGKRFFFRFFHKMDIDLLLSSARWTFNNHLFVIHLLEDGEDPMEVPLVFSIFEVQVHDLPPGLFSKLIAKQLGAFMHCNNPLFNGVGNGSFSTTNST
ncbi:hypothetical protein Gotri_015735, partial [Gossypium trilobum]|nr:hypothetical protein [Gossypium trilobum]